MAAEAVSAVRDIGCIVLGIGSRIVHTDRIVGRLETVDAEEASHAGFVAVAREGAVRVEAFPVAEEAAGIPEEGPVVAFQIGVQEVAVVDVTEVLFAVEVVPAVVEGVLAVVEEAPAVVAGG